VRGGGTGCQARSSTRAASSSRRACSGVIRPSTAEAAALSVELVAAPAWPWAAEAGEGFCSSGSDCGCCSSAAWFAARGRLGRRLLLRVPLRTRRHPTPGGAFWRAVRLFLVLVGPIPGGEGYGFDESGGRPRACRICRTLRRSGSTGSVVFRLLLCQLPWSSSISSPVRG
jgi:hypothetical protein